MTFALAPILAEVSVGWIAALLIALASVCYGMSVRRSMQRLQRSIEQNDAPRGDDDSGAFGDLARAIDRRLRESNQRTALAQTQLEETRKTLRATSIAVIALDPQQRVLDINPAAARMLACEETRARGRLLQEIVREQALNAFVDGALATGGDSSAQLEMRSATSKQSPMTLHASSEPLEMSDGQNGIVLSLVDVTRARQLEAMRSNFAANVSHELRTPITTIRGFVDTLTQLGRTDLDRSERFLAIVQRNVVRLSAIVEDILTLSLLEDPTHHATLDKQRMPVLELMQECAEDLASAAELRKIHIAIEDPHNAVAIVNKSLAIQAVTNLLSNAIRYAPEQSTVTLRSIVNTEESGVEVIDTGSGIPTKHLERIFERFYRVDKSRHRETGGTGLGLAIVKHIAHAHGGRVEAESQIGEGCNFKVWFPSQFPASQHDLNTN
ncbi:MAG: hypothetical protein EXS10_00905 [Phycisphaerales bacterium]|nr:hypothetical protein [Phycisphaerales bacterium]